MRSNKRDGDQSMTGSMFMKEASQKKMANSNTLPQDGHAKGDQSKDLEKNAEKVLLVIHWELL